MFATTAHAGGSHRSPADAQDTKLACSVGRARWRALALPCFATRPLCIGAARSRSGAVAWAASDAPMAAGVVTGGYGCRGRRRDASGAKRVGGRDGRRRRRGRAGATAQHSTGCMSQARCRRAGLNTEAQAKRSFSSSVHMQTLGLARTPGFSLIQHLGGKLNPSAPAGRRRGVLKLNTKERISRKKYIAESLKPVKKKCGRMQRTSPVVAKNSAQCPPSHHGLLMWQALNNN